MHNENTKLFTPTFNNLILRLQVPAEEEPALLASLEVAVAKRSHEEVPRCSVCRVALPSRHLLDLHLAEVHDSFFAAQVARKLKVG